MSPNHRIAFIFGILSAFGLMACGESSKIDASALEEL